MLLNMLSRFNYMGPPVLFEKPDILANKKAF